MEETMEISRQRRIIEIVVGLFVLGIIISLFTLALKTYQNETNNRTALTAMQEPASGNFVSAEARVLGVDPIKGEITVRVNFTPNGNLVKDGELTQDLALYVNSATGGQNRTFPKGKTISPVDVTLDMEGIVTDYPFDHHEAFLELYLTKAEKKGENPKPAYEVPKPAEPIEGDSVKVVPVVQEEESLDVDIFTEFSGSLPGFKLDASIDSHSGGNYNLLKITVNRSSTIEIIVIFAMGLMWLITLTVVFMLLSVVLRERKIEFGMFAFMAGFLFSFVAFRNAMPGVPPIGTLSDYLAFFWGYALISLSLIILTITWLIRPAK
jgi:hypothetical protein